jgi:hypothetical protein
MLVHRPQPTFGKKTMPLKARGLIRARTSEGRERARDRGVRMGRSPKLTPHQRREALRRRNRGTETLADIARS